MHFGPGHVSFESQQYDGKSCCLHGWKTTKSECSWRKVVRKGLKTASSTFRNSPFARQHNISSNGTKSKIFDRVCPKCFMNNLTCKACQCDANNACSCIKRHRVKEAFSKGNGILMIFWSKTELRYQIQDILQVWKCKIWTQIWSITEWLHSQPPKNRIYAFWNYFEACWETRLWNSRYIVRKCVIWAWMWIFRGSVGQFSALSRVGHSWCYKNLFEYLQVLNDVIHFVNTSIYLSSYFNRY